MLVLTSQSLWILVEMIRLSPHYGRARNGTLVYLIPDSMLFLLHHTGQSCGSPSSHAFCSPVSDTARPTTDLAVL